MDAEADIQVWLEAFSRCQPCLIIPYVQTTKDITLRYRINAISEGPAGKSAINQAGTVHANASTKTELARLTINHSTAEVCKIKISVTEPGKAEKLFQFDCPD